MEDFYKKKIIRDFLSLFSESKWKELIFLSVEYGIILLKRNHNVASLSLDDVNNIVDELKEEENKRLKQNLKKYEINSSKEKNIVNKPSSDWRKGDEAISSNKDLPSNINNQQSEIEKFLKERKNRKENEINIKLFNKDIYPLWWADTKEKNRDHRSNNTKSTKNIRGKLQDQRLRNNRSTRNSRSSQMIVSSNQYPNVLKYLPRAASFDDENQGDYGKKNNMYETESKIKSRVVTDKKIFNLLKKKNTVEDNKYISNIGDEDTRNNLDDDFIANYTPYHKNLHDKNYHLNDENKGKRNKINSENQSAQNSYHSQENSIQSENNDKSYSRNYNKEDYQHNDKNNENFNKFIKLEEPCIEYQRENTTGKTNNNLKLSNFTIYKPMDQKDSSNNKLATVNSTHVVSDDSYKKEQFIESDHLNKQRSNYIIEYDKKLKPQTIKEKNTDYTRKAKENFTRNRNPNDQDTDRYNLKYQQKYDNYNRTVNNNMNKDSRNVQKEGIGSFFSNNTNSRFNMMAFESGFNSQPSNRKYDDTMIREQTVQNQLSTKNKNRNETDLNDTYKLSITNTLNTDYQLTSSNPNNYLVSGRSKFQTENTEMNILTSTRSKNDTLEISPHFNNRKEEIKCGKESQKELNFSGSSKYNAKEINNKERVNDTERYLSRNDQLNKQFDESYDCEKLSSYAPSERTKIFYQRDANILNKQRNDLEISGYTSLNSSNNKDRNKNFYKNDPQTFRNDELEDGFRFKSNQSNEQKNLKIFNDRNILKQEVNYTQNLNKEDISYYDSYNSSSIEEKNPKHR